MWDWESLNTIPKQLSPIFPKTQNLSRMNSKSPFTAIAPLVFDGINYQAWAVRMKAYLDANDQWEVVEQIYEVPPLPDNLTLAQIRNKKEMK